MCIIVLVMEGEKLPDYKTLEICQQNNPDGMGFMYRDNNQVIIDKGYFKLEEMYERLKAIEGKEICIHFRWATHGKVAPSTCHPFPKTIHSRLLRATDVITDFGIAHNGIIGRFKGTKKLSDTMQFIQSIHDVSVKHIHEHLYQTDGKFVLMTKYKTYLIGDFIYDSGVYYSNDGYLAPTVKYTNYNFGGGFLDNEYESSVQTKFDPRDILYPGEELTEEVCDICQMYKYDIDECYHCEVYLNPDFFKEKKHPVDEADLQEDFFDLMECA